MSYISDLVLCGDVQPELNHSSAFVPYKGPHAPLDMPAAERGIFDMMRDAFDEVEESGKVVTDVFMTKDLWMCVTCHMKRYCIQFIRLKVDGQIGILWGAKVFIMIKDNILHPSVKCLSGTITENAKSDNDKTIIAINKFDVIADA
jgi:hypothetical protein